MSVQYLKIDTFGAEDTDALFVALCKKTCDLDPDEAKILISAQKLNKSNVVGYKASLTDLLALIHEYDIPFEFKVSFLERGKVEKGVSSTEKKNIPIDASPKVCDTYKQMEKQRSDIKNPELLEEVKPPVFEEPKKATINPKDIPSFP